MTAIPLKWKKFDNCGKVEINGPDNTTIDSSYPALKVNGDIVSTSTATVPTINASTLNGVAIGSSPKFSDTTYTFASGTNGFSVTPLGGSALTVDVTPSIANNITGTGTSDYIAKFNGTNTITSGPSIGNDTTKYLRNDGSWVAPPDTKNTAGATDTSAKIFLVGATSQTDNPQTYSDDQVYVIDGTLSANSIEATNGSSATIALEGSTGKITCNKMNFTDISSLYTITKDSGAWTCEDIVAYRSGNYVQMMITFKSNNTTINAGSNPFVGTLSGGPLPITPARGVMYYTSCAAILNIRETGDITVRWLINNLNIQTNEITISTSFIVND